MSGILFSTAVNSELVARLVILGILSSISLTLLLKSVFLTKLLTLGILFSTAFNAELVARPVTLGILFSTAVDSDLQAKLLTLGILFSTSVILELKTVVNRKPLTLGVLFSTASKSSLLATPLPCFNIFCMLALFALCSVFLTTSFLTTLLSFAKSLQLWH